MVDMAADFPVSVGGRRRRVDIAIFAAGESHAPENIQRVVVCRPEPKQNKRGAVKMRDYEQAEQDIADVKPFFEEIDACEYALWTNGLEFFFLKKKATRFQVDAEPIGDWPLVDESIGDRSVLSRARARRADPEMLRTAFRRCHNFIHGNEGMPKDAAFWQFFYLIFCKMYDERTRRDSRRFWAGPKEQFTIVEANVNILTSLLFLKKKPDEVIAREAIGDAVDYPIFMAVAEKVGFDRRGNTLYKRSAEGEEITKDEEVPETITVSGRKVTRTLRRKTRIPDNDLPEIAKRYRAFRQKHPEPEA